MCLNIRLTEFLYDSVLVNQFLPVISGSRRCQDYAHKDQSWSSFRLSSWRAPPAWTKVRIAEDVVGVQQASERNRELREDDCSLWPGPDGATRSTRDAHCMSHILSPKISVQKLFDYTRGLY